MSREIKFRAWDLDHKEFVYISQTEDGEMWVNNGVSTTVMPYHKCELEQYTGLKDKNGKEIYEGDIVEIDKYGKFQIIWNEWACKFDFDKIGKREREEPLLSQDWEQKAKVIGNIHENQELLGGENEED